MAEDRGVPSSIRSGVVGDVVPSTQEDQCTKRLLGLVLSMVRRAATTAGEYAEHAGRNVVTPSDVQMALKYHAMRFFGEESVAALENFELKEMEDMLEYDSTTEEEEEEEDCEEEQEPKDTEGQEWTRSACECAVCRDMHAAEDVWESWAPEDPAEQFLKVSVNKTISQCNH